MGAVDEISVQIAAINKASAELKKVASDITRLDSVAGGASPGVAKLNSSVTSLGRGFLYASGQSGIMTSELGVLSSAAGGVGVAAAGAAIGVGALAGGILGSVKAAIDFESSFADIKKTVNATDAEFAQLAQANRDLAKELPLTVGEINQIGAIAGQLGISGVANIEKFEKTIASLGISTGLSADVLATAFGTLVSVLGTPIGDVDRLGSSLTALGNNFNSTEGQILDFSVRFAGVAKVLGIGAADVVGISNAFASVGVEAERGGTAVQKVLLGIQQAAVNGGKQLDLFAAITGTTADQFREMVRAGQASEVLVRFIEGLKAAGDQAVPVLEALGVGDERLTAAFLSAASAGDLTRRSLEASREAALQNVATQEEVAKRTGTTASQFQLLKNQVNDLGIELGNQLLPSVNLLLEGLNGLIGAIGATGVTVSDFAAVIIGVVPGINLLAATAAAFDGDWSSTWDSIKSVTETAVNAILSTITQLVHGLGVGVQAVRDAVKDVKGARTALDNIGLSAGLADALKNFSAGSVDFGGGTKPPFSLADVFAIAAGEGVGFQQQPSTTPPGPNPDQDELKRLIALLTQTGAAAGSVLTPLSAVSDGIISLGEALQLALSDQQVVTLELAAASNKAAEAEFRHRIELETLAAVFPGLTSSQVEFRLGLAAIADNLRETNRTAEQFRLAEDVKPELDRLRSAISEALSAPTRETLQLQLQRDNLEQRRLLLLQGGASEKDPRIKDIDRQLAGLDNLIKLREIEVDQLRIKTQLQDKSIASDADQVRQVGLLSTALSSTSTTFDSLRDAVGLQELAQIGLKDRTLEATTALQQLPAAVETILAAANSASASTAPPSAPAPSAPISAPGVGVTAARIPSLDVGVTNFAGGLAKIHKDEIVRLPAGADVFTRAQSRRLLSPAGPPAQVHAPTFNLYITADNDISRRKMEEFAQVIEERLVRKQRQSDRRGAFVTTGGGFP